MKSARIRVLLLALWDIIVLIGVLLSVTFIYRFCGWECFLTGYFRLWPIMAVYLFIAATIRLYHGNPFYPGLPLPPVEELRRLFFAVSLTFLLTFAYLVFTGRTHHYSSFVLFASWGITVLVLPVGRMIIRKLMKIASVGQIPVLIAGGGTSGQRLAFELRRNIHYGFEPVGFLDDKEVPGRVGKVRQAVALGRRLGISTIFVCLSSKSLKKYIHYLMRHYTHVSIMVDEQELPISWAYPVNVKGIAGVEFCNQLRLPGPRIFKVVSEAVLAVLCIIFALPLFLFLAIAVKLSGPGPVLYKARRLGQFGKPIEVWKFRTMVADIDGSLARMLAENPEMAKEWEAKFKLEKDPRITRLGKFLRRTSLDELPQLFNVLRGEMAIIGPRPIVPAEKQYYGNKYEAFSRVKPGITGLWQVSGRSDLDYDRRVALDMYYIFNWSIWHDWYILMLTAVEVIRCRGAR